MYGIHQERYNPMALPTTLLLPPPNTFSVAVVVVGKNSIASMYVKWNIFGQHRKMSVVCHMKVYTTIDGIK